MVTGYLQVGFSSFKGTVSIIINDPPCKDGIIPVYRVTEIDNTYNMRYFPQHVLLCTSTVQDQSGDICIQGYLRIL